VIAQPNDVDVGIELGFHAMVGSDMATAIRARLDARPSVPFAKLTPGWWLYRAPYAGPLGPGKQAVFVVERLTPTGKQAQAIVPDLHGGVGHQMRLSAGSYPGAFVSLDDTLIRCLGLAHGEVVEEAVRRRLPVPPRVQCEHPGLFLEIPARFALADERNGKTAAERVREHLAMDWGNQWPKRPVSAEAVDLWIAEAHRRLCRGRSEAVRRRAMNRDTGADYDRVEQEFGDLIDFYRWLRTHVAPGGVFHVPEEGRVP